MPIFFPNETMDIYTYQKGELDYYGAQHEYVFKESVPVDMQQYSPKSSLKEFGKILQDTYLILFDENIEIQETDQLQINNNKYEIIGSIENCNHGLIPHKEMIIQKQRKEVNPNDGN